MSTNKGYNPRGFRRKDYMANLSNNYNAIIEYAKDTTNGLDIQYRDNYINIYYLGGSLLKLSGRGSVAFDKNYYYLPESLDSLRATHIAALVHKNFRAKVSESKTLSRLSEEELMTCKNIADDINRSLVSSRDNVIKRLKSANNGWRRQWSNRRQRRGSAYRRIPPQWRRESAAGRTAASGSVSSAGTSWKIIRFIIPCRRVNFNHPTCNNFP